MPTPNAQPIPNAIQLLSFILSARQRPGCVVRNRPYCYGVPRTEPAGTKSLYRHFMRPGTRGRQTIFQVLPYPQP